MTEPTTPSTNASDLPDPGSVARARGDVQPIPESAMKWVKPVMRFMSKANVFVYQATNGKVGGKFPGSGAPVCLVTMKGAKSGLTRTIPLIYLPHGDDVIIVASQGGMEKHPVWYYNLVAHPDIEVQDGGRKRKMVARRADDAEKKALWPHILTIYADFEDYQARTDRNIPMFVCSPAG